MSGFFKKINQERVLDELAVAVDLALKCQSAYERVALDRLGVDLEEIDNRLTLLSYLKFFQDREFSRILMDTLFESLKAELFERLEAPRALFWLDISAVLVERTVPWILKKIPDKQENLLLIHSLTCASQVAGYWMSPVDEMYERWRVKSEHQSSAQAFATALVAMKVLPWLSQINNQIHRQKKRSLVSSSLESK